MKTYTITITSKYREELVRLERIARRHDCHSSPITEHEGTA